MKAVIIITEAVRRLVRAGILESDSSFVSVFTRGASLIFIPSRFCGRDFFPFMWAGHTYKVSIVHTKVSLCTCFQSPFITQTVIKVDESTLVDGNRCMTLIWNLKSKWCL